MRVRQRELMHMGLSLVQGAETSSHLRGSRPRLRNT